MAAEARGTGAARATANAVQQQPTTAAPQTTRDTARRADACCLLAFTGMSAVDLCSSESRRECGEKLSHQKGILRSAAMFEEGQRNGLFSLVCEDD